MNYRPRTLRSDLQRRGRVPTADCLRLAIDVASGLGQLHRHGLVHRDVKPGNIIYVDGRAKLADLGLVTTGGEGRTFVGTEGYIPPEGPGSPGADLFALGIALYEASTGLAPDQLPDVPSEWFAEPGSDDALELNEIILKACEGGRERRYQNVEALQADLALLRSGQSVRRVRALERRYARLRVTGVVGTTLLVVAVMAALFASYRSRLAAQSHAREVALRQSAQRAQARAETAERETRRELQFALYEQARALVLSQELGHRTRALQAIRGAAAATNNAAELRRVAFAALSLPDLHRERELALPSMPTLARVDPKFERIALSRPGAPVTICCLADLHVLATLPGATTNTATVALWSADGKFLAVKRQEPDDAYRTDLEVWRVGSTQRVFSVQADISLNSFGFDSHRHRLLAGDVRGTVTVWDLDRAKPLHTFVLPGRPYALACSRDGQRFAASYRRGSAWVVAFHDAMTGALLCSAECPGLIDSIAWHPSGRWVSVTGAEPSEWNRRVRLITADTGTMIVLGRHKIKTATVTFSPDGNYLMSDGWERELLCWDLQSRQRAFAVPNAGLFLDWRSDGRQCAMLLRNGRLQLYAFEPPTGLELSGNRGERLRPGAFSPDGRWLALPDDQNLCVWDLAGHSSPVLLAGAGQWQPFFSPDGTRLFAVGGGIGEAQLRGWHLECPSGGARPAFSPLPMALPPRLNWAALAGTDLVLTSAEGLRFVAQTHVASGQGRTVRIPSGQGTVSPDGRWLAVTYSYSPTVTVYRLPAVEQVARLHTSGLVAGVWFAPAGDELTVINRGGVEWWDSSTWRRRRREPGFPISEAYVLYTPDGRGFWQVTSFRDATLYDRPTGRPILPLPANVLPLALSADGRKLAVSVDDQRVQVWDLLELRARFKELGLDW